MVPALTTFDAVVGRAVAEPEFQTYVLVAFPLVALLLAALGIYGVLASSVVERRSEIGIRMASAPTIAPSSAWLRGRCCCPAPPSIAIGLAVSWAATDVLASLLFNVTPTDTATFAAAVSVLVVAAMAVAFVPARRAARWIR